MLLSTDWFLSYWSTIGVDLAQAVKESLQSGCREIVGQIISGAEEYSFVSFAAERREETQRRFRNLLEETGVSQSCVATINELLRPDQEGSGTRWLITSMTDMLVLGSKNLPADSTIPALAPRIEGALKGMARASG